MSSNLKREKQSKRLLSRNLVVPLALLVVACLTWMRASPTPDLSIASNTEVKVALSEINHSYGAAQRTQQNGNAEEDDYNNQLDTSSIDKIGVLEQQGDDYAKNGIAATVQRSASRYQVRTKYDIDPDDTERKYFVYQPSGGWGNQRMILRWALRVANAMDRTLIVPMIAPHNRMWWGYDRLNASDMVAADEVLDMEALEAGTIRGVRVHRDHLNTLPSILPGTWFRYSKRSTIWLKENDIKSKWRWRTERVIFWNKGSMWECCGGGIQMTPYVMFNSVFKLFARQLTDTFFGKDVPYNAVHVRRGGGHTRIDRRTPQHYYELKLKPAGFERNIPIYVATDEKDKNWFSYLQDEQQFTLVFWDELASVQLPQVNEFFSRFPERMKNDIIGFLEQLICGRAAKWTGSDGSTFSFSIEGIRKFPSLVDPDWKKNMDDKMRRIYAHDGKGVQYSSPESDAEAAREQQAMGNTSNDDNVHDADDS